jgi:hypothetical protein
VRVTEPPRPHLRAVLQGVPALEAPLVPFVEELHHAHPFHAVNAELLAGGRIDLPAHADAADVLPFTQPGPGNQSSR